MTKAPNIVGIGLIIRALARLPSAAALCIAISASAQQQAGDALERVRDLRREDPKAAIALLTETIKTLPAESGVRREARLHQLRAEITRNLGRMDAALADAERVEALAERAGDPVLEARSLRLRGTIEAEQGNIAAALERFHEARELLEGTDAHELLTRTLIAVGVAHTMGEDYEQAQPYLERALSLARDMGDKSMQATALGNLALVHAEVRGPEAALERHREALALAEAIGDKGIAANQLANICAFEVDTEQLERADRTCHRALDLLEALGHARLLAGTRGSLGELMAKQGRVEEALEHYRRALEAASGRIPTVERDVLEKLAELHERRGRPAAALDAYKRLMKKRQELWNQQRQKVVEDLEVRYDLQRREREIEVLELQSKLQQARLERRKWFLIGLGVVVILLLVLVLVVMRGMRIRGRLQRTLAARNRELEEAVETIGELARVDPLTNLLNRRTFLESAGHEMARSRRQGTPIAIAMADIDHFKQINDTHGHHVGDVLLKGVARRINDRLREVDIVCRWGGEEFVFLFPDTDVEAASKVLERIRETIAEHPFDTSAGELGLTITCGIAPLKHDLDEAIKQADRAMYQGKRAGRNCVRVIDDDAM